jgi:HSP20 family protein
MSLVTWETPRRELDRSTRSMRRLFEDFDRNLLHVPFLTSQGTFIPSVDINEDEDNIYIIAELPGLSSDDVKLSVSDGVLSIRGEKKRNEEQHDHNFYRMERTYGEFVRQFAMPEDVKENDIQANFKDGLLEIMVPKKEPSKPTEHVIPIQKGKELFVGDGRAKTTNGREKRSMALA